MYFLIAGTEICQLLSSEFKLMSWVFIEANYFRRLVLSDVDLKKKLTNYKKTANYAIFTSTLDGVMSGRQKTHKEER